VTGVQDVCSSDLIARRTLPVWLYVSVTGVVVYLLLYHVG